MQEIYKRYLKYLFLIVLLFVVGIFLFIGVQKYKEQKDVYLELLEYKKTLEQKLAQAQISQEKNKLSKEKSYQEPKQVQAVQEQGLSKIKIHSQLLNISDLRKYFYQNPSYEKALNLAHKYFELKVYKKSVFWALKANELNKYKQDSWIIFAKAKKALGEEKEANKALDAYVNYYGFIELDGK